MPSHLLYATWVPTLHHISKSELKTVCTILSAKGKELNSIPEDFSLKNDILNNNEYVCLKLNTPENAIFLLHNSGLLFVEVKDYKLDKKKFENECRDEYYIPTKEVLHLHFFSHVLSEKFPFYEEYPEEGCTKIIETLYSRYTDDLKSEMRLERGLYHKGLSSMGIRINDYSKLKRIPRSLRDTDYVYNVICLLRKLRYMFESVTELTRKHAYITNVTGVQTFINSFVSLTQPLVRNSPPINSEFFKAQSLRDEYSGDIRDLYSTFPIQVMMIYFAILGSIISLLGFFWGAFLLGLTTISLPLVESVPPLIIKMFAMIITFLLVYESIYQIGRGVAKTYSSILELES